MCQGDASGRIYRANDTETFMISIKKANVYLNLDQDPLIFNWSCKKFEGA